VFTFTPQLYYTPRKSPRYPFDRRLEAKSRLTNCEAAYCVLFVVHCYFLFLVPKCLSQHLSLSRSVYVGYSTQSLETLQLPLHLLLYQACCSCISFLLSFSVGCFTRKWLVVISNMNITFLTSQKYVYSWYMKSGVSVEIYDGPYQDEQMFKSSLYVTF
jgi:hypothetical protein